MRDLERLYELSNGVFDFSYIPTKNDIPKGYGYYCLVQGNVGAYVLKFKDVCAVLDFIKLVNESTEMKASRMQSKDLKTHFMNKAIVKTYYAITHNEPESFKKGRKVWNIHSFSSNADRLLFVSTMKNKGEYVKAVSHREMLLCKDNSKALNYYAALNQLGADAPIGDKNWKVFRFHSILERKEWMREKNLASVIAIKITPSEIYKYALLKHGAAYDVNSDGMIMVDHANMKFSAPKKFYIALNKKNIDSAPSDHNWEIFATSSMSSCKDMIGMYNKDCKVVAKKVDRQFAYAVLGIEGDALTYVDKDNRVCLWEQATEFKMIA